MSGKITKKTEKEATLEPQEKQLFLPTEIEFGYQQLLNSYIKNGMIQKIGSIPFCIWIILRAHVIPSGKNIGKVFLSYGNIRKITGYGINTIRESIKTLQTEGLITVVEDKSKTNTKRYYTVEFLVSESDSNKKIAIPYLPAKARELREKTQKFIEGRSDIPEGVTVYQDNRQVHVINNKKYIFVVGSQEQVDQIVEKIREEEEKDKEVMSRWIRSPKLLAKLSDQLEEDED